MELIKVFGIKINSQYSETDNIKKILAMTIEEFGKDPENIELRHETEYHFHFDDTIIGQIIFFGAGNEYDKPSLIIYSKENIKKKIFGPYSGSYNFDNIHKAIIVNDETDEFDEIINYCGTITNEMKNSEITFSKETNIDKKWHWTLFWTLG